MKQLFLCLLAGESVPIELNFVIEFRPIKENLGASVSAFPKAGHHRVCSNLSGKIFDLEKVEKYYCPFQS